jgi:uncharacterized protein
LSKVPVRIRTAKGTADASVVALAERLDTRLIVTLDRRHFALVRGADGGSFELLR